MGQLKKILLIGATGFVGSNILQKLHNTYDIHSITKSHNVDFADLDTVSNLLEQIKPDVVINCLTYGQKQLGPNPSLEVAKNISVFYNFLTCSDKFDQFINVGSGAEFDRAKNIDCAEEIDINKILPKDSYGFAKNLISRSIQSHAEKFITLRLFGCFGENEWPTRLLPKFLHSETALELQDRYFDYISIQDFVQIVDYVIQQRPQVNDINCVYSDKLKLSEILSLFCKLQNLVPKFVVTAQSQFNYTGASSRLNYYKDQLRLQGLEQGLRDYL